MYQKNPENRIRELHEFFSLEHSNTLKTTHFSKGMLQKTNLMQAMIKTPDVLVLDEPFSGLDKESAGDLLHFINLTGRLVMVATTKSLVYPY